MKHDMTPEIFCLALTNDMPRDEWLHWLRTLAKRDLMMGRRAALVRAVWDEANLRPNGLFHRVQDLLGLGCFGATPFETLTQDMEAVRQTFAAEGHTLERNERGGYYVVGRSLGDPYLKKLIEGSIAEVDPKQIAIYRKLTPAQRVRQCVDLSDWLWQANQRRLARKKRITHEQSNPTAHEPDNVRTSGH